MTLGEKQKEMISDMLQRTKTATDIDDFERRILGNAYGTKECARTYRFLAAMRIKRFAR